jgi:hypothetical protein
MSIQRVPVVPFAQIANETLREKRLSFRARGILAMVLSNVGEWQASRNWIVSMTSGEGKAAIQTALNELTELGYRRVVKEKDSNGRFQTVTEWFHFPHTESAKEPIIRPTENQTVGFPDGRETGWSIEHYPKEHYPKEQHENISADRFSDFWIAYPLKTSKPAARRAFVKAVKNNNVELIIQGAKSYRDDPNRDPRFTAHAATWLNNERWNDDPLPDRSNSAGQRKMRRTEDLLQWAAMEDQRSIGS